MSLLWSPDSIEAARLQEERGRGQVQERTSADARSTYTLGRPSPPPLPPISCSDCPSMVEIALSTSSSTSLQQPNQTSAARMSPPQTALIVGASRGLGLALVNELVKRGSPNVYATVRSHAKEGQFPKGVKVIEVCFCFYARSACDMMS